MTRDPSERPSTPSLIGDAIRQASALASAEIALIRLEATEKLTGALASVVSLVVAAVFMIVAMIFLLQGIVELLVAKGVAGFAASFIVGGVIAAVALAAVALAARNLRLVHLKPTRTLRQVEIARSVARGRRS